MKLIGQSQGILTPPRCILEKGWGISSQPGHEDLEYAETGIPFGLDSARRRQVLSTIHSPKPHKKFGGYKAID
jgi:hypothetical protein